MICWKEYKQNYKSTKSSVLFCKYLSLQLVKYSKCAYVYYFLYEKGPNCLRFLHEKKIGVTNKKLFPKFSKIELS